MRKQHIGTSTILNTNIWVKNLKFYCFPEVFKSCEGKKIHCCIGESKNWSWKPETSLDKKPICPVRDEIHIQL